MADCHTCCKSQSAYSVCQYQYKIVRHNTMQSIASYGKKLTVNTPKRLDDEKAIRKAMVLKLGGLNHKETVLVGGQTICWEMSFNAVFELVRKHSAALNGSGFSQAGIYVPVKMLQLLTNNFKITQ